MPGQAEQGNTNLTRSSARLRQSSLEPEDKDARQRHQENPATHTDKTRFTTPSEHQLDDSLPSAETIANKVGD
jgi:hypothetical protein